VTIAARAEADAWRNGDVSLVDQACSRANRTEVPPRLRDRRPDEHRAARLVEIRPARASEPVHQRLGTAAVELTKILRKLVAVIQRPGGSVLDRRERAVVQVRLQVRQGRDHPRVAHHQPDAPAGHVVALRGRKCLDREAFHPLWREPTIENTGRVALLKIQIRIGEVVQQHRAGLFDHAHDACELFARDHLARRILRVIRDHQLGALAASEHSFDRRLNRR
jgi:hypothetical protein